MSLFTDEEVDGQRGPVACPRHPAGVMEAKGPLPSTGFAKPPTSGLAQGSMGCPSRTARSQRPSLSSLHKAPPFCGLGPEERSALGRRGGPATRWRWCSTSSTSGAGLRRPPGHP